jgi:hypothetical protein
MNRWFAPQVVFSRKTSGRCGGKTPPAEQTIDFNSIMLQIQFDLIP